MRRAAVALVLVAGFAVLPAAVASAHPLGNFSVNHYAGLRIGPEEASVDYVLDIAEIPTFQAKDAITAQGESAWAADRCARIARGLRLELGRRTVALAVRSSAIAFAPGAGGLPVSRVGCSMTARRAPGTATVVFRDGNDVDHVGWREITAVGDGTTLVHSDVPTASVSRRLTRYPHDLLKSPLHVMAAHLDVRPGGATAGRSEQDPGIRISGLPLGADRLGARFTSLVSRQHVTPWFLALAIGVALVLGAFHALAPGHGKTVMAAYLVGQNGSAGQAALIGLTVTITHTAGVLTLGLALSASRLLAPERLYPWLTLSSGVLFAGIGVSLVRRSLRVRRTLERPAVYDHAHDHAHDHTHGPHTHGPHTDGPHRRAGEPVGRRGLLTLGLAGGVVPTPSALVVLLAASSLGRYWLGVVLVLAYGAGMAAVLTGIGFALARARGLIDRRGDRWRSSRLRAWGQWVPLATASLIVVVGSTIALRGATGL